MNLLKNIYIYDVFEIWIFTNPSFYIGKERNNEL